MNTEATNPDTTNTETTNTDKTDNLHAQHGRLGQGRKSPAGLAASSKNATKHGLSSKSFVLLPTEKRELFFAHKLQLEKALQPRDAYEFELVSQMVEAIWLINRSKEMERTALRLEIQRQRLAHEEEGMPFDESILAWLATEALTLRNPAFANLSRYRAQHERTLFRAQRALEAHRKTKPVIPPAELPADLDLPADGVDDNHPDSQFLPVLPEYKTKPLPPTLLPPSLPPDPPNIL